MISFALFHTQKSLSMSPRHKLLVALFALTGLSTAVFAAGDGERVQKHSVRIGWGDMLYETAVYYPTATHVFDYPAGLPETYRSKERYNYKFTGHIFAEYRYSFSELFSAGIMADYESFSWENALFDRYHKKTEQLPDSKFHNIVIMPTARFCYFHKGPVRLYSGLGAGMLASIGASTELAPAIYLNVIGLQYGNGHWSGAIDLGALNAFDGVRSIYMLGSRLISISVNYSW